jgi:hypothetical protein
VPEVGSTRERSIRPGVDLEIDTFQVLGRRTVADLRELQAPARSVAHRGRPSDREALVRALAAEDGPDGVAALGPVGQDLYADDAAQAVDAPNESDREAIGPGFRNLGRMGRESSLELGQLSSVDLGRTASRSSACGFGGLILGHRRGCQLSVPL